MLCTGVATLAVSFWLTLAPPAIGNLLVPPLEQRFKRTAIGDPATITGVIALGGGDARLREACRLAGLYPHFRVFISGHGDESTVREALGPRFGNCRFELENVSHNTRTNATFTRKALNPKQGERWLLATSAAHMPRSIGAFRKAGMDVEPWPIFDLDNKPWARAVAQHEWLGLISYWVRGHSSELFPAPQLSAVSTTKREASLETTPIF